MPGVYLLTIDGGYEQGGLIVDGESGLEVIFQTLTSTWEAKVSPAGSMPGFSVVRVEVDGMRGLPVYIWKEDWEGMMRRTGSKPEYGECAAEFSPLGPGHYMIEPEGIGVWVDVELTGLEVVWIDFRRKSVPTSPNVVQPLSHQAPLPPSAAVLPEPWEENGFAADRGSKAGGDAEPDLLEDEWGAMSDSASPQPRPASDRHYDDEPTFSDDADDDAGSKYAGSGPVGNDKDETEPLDATPLAGNDAQPPSYEQPGDEAPGDEQGWRSSLATSSAMDFRLPSLTRSEDDEDFGAFEGDFDEEFEEDFEADFEDEVLVEDEINVDEAAFADDEETPADRSGESPTQSAASQPVNAPVSAPANLPITLLIPTPVTDLDDLAALVRFVQTHQITMARTVDEVPDGSRVLLIGTTGEEDWSEVERQLAARDLVFDRVMGSLSKALADDSLLGQ